MKKIKVLSVIIACMLIVSAFCFSVSAEEFEGRNASITVPEGYSQREVENVAQGTEDFAVTDGLWINDEGNILRIVSGDNNYGWYYEAGETYEYDLEQINEDMLYNSLIGFELESYKVESVTVNSLGALKSTALYKNLVDGEAYTSVKYDFYTESKLISVDLFSKGMEIAPELLAAADTIKLTEKIYTYEDYEADNRDYYGEYEDFDDFYDDYDYEVDVEDYIEDIFDIDSDGEGAIFAVFMLISLAMAFVPVVIIVIVVIVLVNKNKKKEEARKKQLEAFYKSTYAQKSEPAVTDTQKPDWEQ